MVQLRREGLLSAASIAVAVQSAVELERVIEQFARQSTSALIVLPDLFTATNRQSVIALAARHRLPAVHPFRYFAASGGLMSYETELLDTYRQGAAYVDRILKGERASDLSVQQPTKFEQVINLKTAKAIGLAIPPTLIASARSLSSAHPVGFALHCLTHCAGHPGKVAIPCST